jgi:hypothetical protein
VQKNTGKLRWNSLKDEIVQMCSAAFLRVNVKPNDCRRSCTSLPTKRSLICKLHILFSERFLYFTAPTVS